MPARPPANLREHLRLVTRDAHLRLEAEVDFDGRLTSLEVYRYFLEDFFRFVRPVEAVLDGLDLKTLGIDYSSRRKTGWIETDLKDLGHTSESLEHLQSFEELPQLTEPVEALGAMYVLEGSSLGRQVMLSKLAERLNITSRLGRPLFQRLWQRDRRDVAQLHYSLERGGQSAGGRAPY